ncbi:KAP family P-loop NTPase fold protein [Gilvibacter sp.]|uniref:KAP family P-loop NTPase fold protein n=1 Tax=Gilvibacter sp. TaxID=2729997 RepID=UPI003B5261D0
MSLRHKDPLIPTDGSDPFVNCKLGRKKYAEVLTAIVNSYSDGFVLAINNAWGTGKSTFVKMWRQDLINQGYKTLYFNAWENDFQEEVIIALLSELKELNPKKGETFNSLLEKTATFLTKAAPAVAKGVASKAIGSDGVAEVIAAATEFTAEQVEEQIAGFNKKKAGIADFRKSLEQFVDEVDNDKPVVFIIDELDRCRPSYAVEVLEQIKHLFAVEGIVFALSIDKVQLGNAIRGFYGSDLIDADEYLRRFIDLEYQIPDPDESDFAKYLYRYYGFEDFYNHKARKENLKSEQDSEQFYRAFTFLFERLRPRLRTQEKIMAQLRVILKSFEFSDYTASYVLFLMTLLKFNNPELFNKISNYSLTSQELVDEFENYFARTETGKTDNEHFEVVLIALAHLLVCYSNNKRYDFKTTLIQKGTDGYPELAISSKLNNNIGGADLLDMITWIKRTPPFNHLDVSTLLNRINLIDKIKT